MSEVRRPSDTLPISRAELDTLLEQARAEAEERDSAILRARAAAAGAFDQEELSTLVQCLACGGEYERLEKRADGGFEVVTCRHCTRGGQTTAQIRRWREHRRESTKP